MVHVYGCKVMEPPPCGTLDHDCDSGPNLGLGSDTGLQVDAAEPSPDQHRIGGLASRPASASTSWLRRGPSHCQPGWHTDDSVAGVVVGSVEDWAFMWKDFNGKVKTKQAFI